MAITKLICEWCQGELGEPAIYQAAFLRDGSMEDEQVFCSWECCDRSNNYEEESK